MEPPQDPERRPDAAPAPDLDRASQPEETSREAPDDAGEAARSLRAGLLRRVFEPDATFVLTRFVFLRLLGLIYLVAFLSLALQLRPLLGHHGLLPADLFLERVLAATGSPSEAFARLPTLFWWLGASDATLLSACWIGVGLSAAVLAGVTNALVQLALWALYMSLVHVGQIFYGYGWEIQLLETGFLSIFLCPLRSVAPLRSAPPPAAVMWLLRWLAFRIMLGAGLIKLRGDPCWRDLTCLVYHYETQPVPNPLSYYLHQLPVPAHKVGVLFNHLVELVAPWFLFTPRRLRHAAGLLVVAFQVILIFSGNLSFLNWLTILPAIACFDDAALRRVAPSRLRAWLSDRVPRRAPSRPQRVAAGVLAAVVLALSIEPVTNMFSPGQRMNAAFDPLALVNTYGAFGSVGKVRHEVILEGTDDAVLSEATRWKEYELPCKPGDVRRRPCVITPYHYRLDWQIWFAAMSSYERQPWLIHLVDKLLRGDRAVKRLLANDPFPDRPPRYVRAWLYRYEFTPAGDGSGAWWRRTRARAYIPPLSADDPGLRRFLAAHGWTR